MSEVPVRRHKLENLILSVIQTVVNKMLEGSEIDPDSIVINAEHEYGNSYRLEGQIKAPNGDVAIVFSHQVEL